MLSARRVFRVALRWGTTVTQTVRIRRVNVIVFVVIAYVVHGYQPHVGASADALLAFTEESQCILYANYGNLVTLHPPR